MLTAVSVGSVKVDANQAGGSGSGNLYAAATQVQAPITITNTVVASDVPALLMNQIVWSYQSGAFTDGQNPAGGSFAVTPNGLIYVGTTLQQQDRHREPKHRRPGSVDIDERRWRFHHRQQRQPLHGAPLQLGGLQDSVCKWRVCGVERSVVGAKLHRHRHNHCAPLPIFPAAERRRVAFDASGNLYMVTVPASPGVNAIYECAAACQIGGTATLVYSDTTGAVSQIAFDPWGNMFFTDGIYNDTSFANDDKVRASNLYELPYTSGTGFATTPLLLQTLTDASPGNYDNQLDGVAVTSTGTIYYADQNDGLFAIPNTKAGGPDTAHQYVVSALGAKGMELDSNGNEWVVVYHAGGDNLGEALISDLTTPNAQYDGAPVTARLQLWTTPCPAQQLQPSPSLPPIRNSALRLVPPAPTISADLHHSGRRLFLYGNYHLHGDKAKFSNRNADGYRYHERWRRNRNGDRLRLDDSADAHLYGAYNNRLHLFARRDDHGKRHQRWVEQSGAFTVDTSSTGTGTFSATTVTGTTSVGYADRYPGGKHCYRCQRTWRPCERHVLRRCTAGPADAHHQQGSGDDHLYPADLAGRVFTGIDD